MHLLASDMSSVGYVVAIIGVFVAIFLFCFIFVWLSDMLKRPAPAWEAAGQNRTLWIILWIVTFVVGVNPILGAIYWFVIRPKVAAATPAAA
jgi:hypothetical protein